jgi:hypothetical protein
MKKLLILSLSLITFFGYSQTLVDPTLSPTTARINAALSDAVAASGTDTYTGTKSGLTNVINRAYSVTFTNDNSGASTFNLNGSGAVEIRKFESNALVPLVDGDISDGETKRLRYNGTYLVIEGGSGSSVEVGTVQQVTGTSPIVITSTPTTTPNVTINNAAADGSTKGAASFTAADFDASSGNISIDYTNGQAASGSNKGFLTSADWTTFNGKQSALTLGTGVQTWLATPSWTNFNSAITGTAPFWSLAIGGTITGVNTLTSNAANQHIFTGTWTTTANNQFHSNWAGSITSRNTVGEAFIGHKFTPTLIASANSQIPTSVLISPTFTLGAFTGLSPRALQVDGVTMINGNLNGAGIPTLTVNAASGNTNIARFVNPAVTNGWVELSSSATGTFSLLQNSGYGITFSPSSGLTLNSPNNQIVFTQAANSTSILFGQQGTSPTTARFFATLTTSPSATTAFTPTSGTAGLYNIMNTGNSAFQPSSGTATWATLYVRPTINQTGTATGTVYGIDYDPEITSVTGTHLAWRNTTGNLLIGATTPTASTRVDQRGLGTTSSTINHRWANSSNTVLAQLTDDGALALKSTIVGRAALVGGTVTVNTSVVQSGDEIFLTNRITGGTVGFLSVGTVTNGTSFVINSTSALDTSTISWMIIKTAP